MFTLSPAILPMHVGCAMRSCVSKTLRASSKCQFRDGVLSLPQPVMQAASTSAPTLLTLASMQQRAASPAVPQHSQKGASIATSSSFSYQLHLASSTYSKG